MRMSACDVCGASSDSLTELHEQYRIDFVRDVCPKCEREISDTIRKINKILDPRKHGIVRRFIENLKKIGGGQ